MRYTSDISGSRIWAMVVHEIYVTKHSLEIFFDIMIFPLINLLLFGLISLFISRTNTNSQFLMVGVLLWEIVTIMQYNVTVSTMWEVWSHNLTNIFTTPISVFEYLTAHVVAGLIKTASVVLIMALAAAGLFHFNLLDVGLVNLAFFAINLAVFAVWLGIVLLGFIFRFGTRMAAVSWGLVFLFQPLTAAFFPVSILPHWLQSVAHVIPITYVFAEARQALNGGGILWSGFFWTLLANLLYAVLACWVFARLFKKSKDTGQFARNDLG